MLPPAVGPLAARRVLGRGRRVARPWAAHRPPGPPAAPPRAALAGVGHARLYRERSWVGTRPLGRPRARAPGAGRLILARRQPLGYDDFRTGQGPAIVGMGGLRSREGVG